MIPTFTPRVQQPISTLVKIWCQKQNMDSGADRWLAGLWCALAVLLIAFMATNAGWLLIAAILVGFGWLVAAPKPVHYGSYRTRYSGHSVPDLVLAHIADSDKVPEWVKSELGAALEKHGTITFDQLFQAESWFEHEVELGAKTKGVGYQKMTAFVREQPTR